jgi:hypothetical protein
METTMKDRWLVPAVGVGLGLLLFGAAAVGGQPWWGLGMLAVMTLYAGFLVALGGRSETVGVLAGRPSDERMQMFNVVATAVAGIVAIIVAISGYLWSIANGQSGNDFALVAAAAGIGYLGALAWLHMHG